MNICLVVGTRPEAIKLAPIRRLLPEAQLLVLHQHTTLMDPALLHPSMKPAVAVAIKRNGTSLGALLATTLEAASWGIEHLPQRPEVVLVQGDTASALAGALAAFTLEIPVAHVEAGLRTDCPITPFPEEMIRRLITRLATIHFAPTNRAADNLHREGVLHDVYITGNTGIDALHHVLRQQAAPSRGQRRRRSAPAHADVLITYHRRESRETTLPALLAATEALRKQGVTILWPNHPGVRAGTCAPLAHGDLVEALTRAQLVMTDSGGIIEEAAALGKRLVILRFATERPEALAKPTEARLLTHDDLPRLAEIVTARLREPPPPPNEVFGDGTAANQILRILEQRLRNPRNQPPHGGLHHVTNCCYRRPGIHRAPPVPPPAGGNPRHR